MPTRSGAQYHLRFSDVDNKPCCNNGCPAGGDEEPCKCAPCPLCDTRVPGWVLTLKSPYMANGLWVGPHCIECDVELFVRGMYSGCVRWGGETCHCTQCRQ
jgi:hypothetical protein